jgi:hypothetical protein
MIMISLHEIPKVSWTGSKCHKFGVSHTQVEHYQAMGKLAAFDPSLCKALYQKLRKTKRS